MAAVSSIGSAIDLLSNDDWKEKYLMIEVMTCPGRTLYDMIFCRWMNMSYPFPLFLLLDEHRRRLFGRWR